MVTDRLLRALRLRLPGGLRWEQLQRFRRLYRQTGEEDYGRMCRLLRRNYFLGPASGMYDLQPGEEYSGGRLLYHMTPRENVPSVLQGGLRPGRGVVWLTDDVPALRGRIGRYNARRGQPELELLEVSAPELRSSGRRVWRTDREYELVAFYVPPDCIRCVPWPEERAEGSAV